MSLRFFVLVICISIAFCCVEIKPTKASDCWNSHSMILACCYSEYYGNKAVEPSMISCSELKPYLAVTGVVYTGGIPQFNNCGSYSEQFPQDKTVTCGDYPPLTVEDCTQFSTEDSRCCYLQTVAGINTYQSCFHSGSTSIYKYSNRVDNITIHNVDCNSTFYRLSKSLALFLIFIILSILI